MCHIRKARRASAAPQQRSTRPKRRRQLVPVPAPALLEAAHCPSAIRTRQLSQIEVKEIRESTYVKHESKAFTCIYWHKGPAPHMRPSVYLLLRREKRLVKIRAPGFG